MARAPARYHTKNDCAIWRTYFFACNEKISSCDLACFLSIQNPCQVRKRRNGRQNRGFGGEIGVRWELARRLMPTNQANVIGNCSRIRQAAHNLSSCAAADLFFCARPEGRPLRAPRFRADGTAVPGTRGYCTTSPCKLMSRPSISTSLVTRRPMIRSITLRITKEATAVQTIVATMP